MRKGGAFQFFFSALSLSIIPCALAKTADLPAPSSPALASKINYRGDMKSPDFGRQITYMPRFSVGPFYQTDNGSFGLYDLFAPFTFDSKTIMFADGRYIDRGNSWEYNIGMGFRNIISSGNLLWTIYSFYDNRRTRFAHKFGQVTVGADFQTEKWYFNTNVYIPVGRTQAFVDQFNTAYLCQNNTRICYARGIERSMSGWDAEVGQEFLPHLRGYAGVYVFARKGIQTAAGPNLRLQYDLERSGERRIIRVFDKIALLANWRYDHLSGNIWYAGARFDISLGPRPHYVGIERKMTSFIRRDLNVEMSSDGQGAKAAATQPVRVLTNTFDGEQTQVALVASGTSDANFNAVVTNARNNIVGIEGTVVTTTVKQLSANQVLEGGVYSFTREGANFSAQVGQSGAISRNGAAGFALVDVGATATQNNTVENMAFNNAGAAAAEAAIVDSTNAGVGSLTIQNNTQSTQGNFAILDLNAATTDSTIVVQNNTLTTAGVDATNGIVEIINGAAASTITATVYANTITSTLDTSGVRLSGTNAGLFTASVSDNNITTANAGAVARAALMIDGSTTNANFNISTIASNTLTTTAATGAALYLRNNVNVSGSINNNTLSGGGQATLGVVTFEAPANNESVIVAGAVTNNAITNTTTQRSVAFVASGTDTGIYLDGGFVSNAIVTTGAAAEGVVTHTAAASGVVAFSGFQNNTFTGTYTVGGQVITNDTNTGSNTFGIGNGAIPTTANLAAANGLVAGDITLNAAGGATTIQPY